MSTKVEDVIISLDLKNKSGIYCITINNKKYIGSAINLYQRLHLHKYNLITNVHCNSKLQNSFNNHFEFDYDILEYVTKENLINREQYYIDTIHPYFNIRQIADSNYGLKAKQTTINKMSNSHKERHLEHPYTSETIAKMKESAKNRIISDEQKAKTAIIKRNQQLGKTHTNATKELCRIKMIESRRTSTNYNSKGEKNNQSKLKDTEVLEIRESLRNGVTGVKLADKYNVSIYCISLIKRNKTYTHLL